MNKTAFSGKYNHKVIQEVKQWLSERENARIPLKTEFFSETLKSKKNVNPVKQHNFTRGKISVSKKPSTIDIPWYHIISNKSFGTMLSDKSLGFTRALNSGRNKITPWDNDDMTDNRGERLFLKISDKLYDIALISDVIFTPRKCCL